jgi:hypothetical protein
MRIPQAETFVTRDEVRISTGAMRPLELTMLDGAIILALYRNDRRRMLLGHHRPHWRDCATTVPRRAK